MDDTLQATLNWVNRLREKYGMPTLTDLPQGRRRVAGSCPIARALTGIGTDGIEYQADVRYMKMPAAVVADMKEVEVTHMPGYYDVSWPVLRLGHRAKYYSWCDETLPLPRSVSEFVERFDEGKYPHLEA